jgi:hypothetical protein
MKRRMILGIACVCGMAQAHSPFPKPVPLDRLVENFTVYLEANPDDAGAHYRLARVHYMAFSLGRSSMLVHQPNTPTPRVAERDWQGRTFPQQEDVNFDDLTKEERAANLNAAIEHFNRAIRLDGDSGLYKLGLASLMEEAEGDLSRVTAIPLDPIVLHKDRGIDHVVHYRDAKTVERSLMNDEARSILDDVDGWGLLGARDAMISQLYALRDSPKQDVREQASHRVAADWSAVTAYLYFAAFADALGAEAGYTEQPLHGFRSLVAYQAGTEYLRYADKIGEKNRIRRETIETALNGIQSLPHSGWITPLIFSLDGAQPLDDLLSRETAVGFDLDGTGRDQRWPWVKPDTGILVWDPENTGVVTSGRQLFGSVTWWIFFDHGFQALSMLDDNADGAIAGSELQGLAVWFDANSDGVSQSGEVIPIHQLPIRSIACSFDTTDGASLVSTNGLTLTNGETLPVYDWVTHPAETTR